MQVNRLLIAALTLMAGLTHANLPRLAHAQISQSDALQNINEARSRRDAAQAHINAATDELIARLQLHRNLGGLVAAQSEAVELQCQPHLDTMYEALLYADDKLALAQEAIDRGQAELNVAEDMYALHDWDAAYWSARKSIWDGFTPSHNHSGISGLYWPAYDQAHQQILIILGL